MVKISLRSKFDLVRIYQDYKRSQKLSVEKKKSKIENTQQEAKEDSWNKKNSECVRKMNMEHERVTVIVSLLKFLTSLPYSRYMLTFS